MKIKDCKICGSNKNARHSEYYDSYFCYIHNVWIEPFCNCVDDECPNFGKTRPERPFDSYSTFLTMFSSEDELELVKILDSKYLSLDKLNQSNLNKIEEFFEIVKYISDHC